MYCKIECLENNKIWENAFEKYGNYKKKNIGMNTNCYALICGLLV